MQAKVLTQQRPQSQTQNVKPELQPPSQSCIQTISDSAANDLLLQKSPLKRVTYGMRNLGNTCFFNSVMQCLTHSKPLLNFCLKGTHSQQCKKSQACFLCFYTQYVQAIGQNQKTNPNIIVQRLRNIWQRYSIGRQEDAHEFLMIFVESLMNSCIQMAKPSKEFMYKNQNKTSIFKIFGGKSRSQVQCLGCNHKSNTYEDLFTLSLDFPKNKSSSFGGGAASLTLDQCLNNFCSTEILKGDNKYSCSACKKKCEAKKRFSIEQSPRILIVHLKRFTNFGMKIGSYIKYPKSFSLKNYMSKSIDQEKDKNNDQEIYDLYGVVVHQGGGCRSGHYYSYVQGLDGDWYNCNDDYVSRVSSGVDGVLSQQAYILFYQKRVTAIQEPKIIETKVAIAKTESFLKVQEQQVSTISKEKQVIVVKGDTSPIEVTSLSNKSTSLSSNSDRETAKADDTNSSSNHSDTSPQIQKFILPQSSKEQIKLLAQSKCLNLDKTQVDMKIDGTVLFEPKISKEKAQLETSILSKFLNQQKSNEVTPSVSKVKEIPRSESKMKPNGDQEMKEEEDTMMASNKSRNTLSSDLDSQSQSKDDVSEKHPHLHSSMSKSYAHIPIKRDLHPLFMNQQSKKRKREAINSLMSQTERQSQLLKRFKCNINPSYPVQGKF